MEYLIYTLFVFSEVSYGSHTNTHRLTDTSSHRGSRHLLTPAYPGHNGIGHINGFGDLNGDTTEEKVADMLELNQVPSTFIPSTLLTTLLQGSG